MYSIISGVIMAGAGGATLWYCLPRNGVVHPLMKRPLMDFTIPIAIVSGVSIGIALIIVGIAG
jgi:hypothetical protein